MPNFTKIPDSFREEYKKKFLPLSSNEEVKEKAEADPVIFAYFYLGKKVRLHQAFIIDKIINAKRNDEDIGPRVAACWARQLGKSICLGIFLIWACWYNKYPVTISNITVIYITSKEDDSAIELLEKIKLIIYDGDRHMQKYEEDHYFTGDFKEPNNTHQMTFSNNCFMKSIPPTMKAVGKSASWFLIDEAHRLRCVDTTPDTFFDLASAMVGETGGGILLSSSPQGLTSFFYNAIDPENKDPDNEYEHFWFDHTIWDDDSKACKRYKAFVQSEKIRLTKAGRFKYWQQEYGALFTVTESAFFDYQDIVDGVKDTPSLYEYKDTPCSAGYDYGQSNARTVITIRTMIKEEIIEIFQHRCPAGFDNNKLREPEWEHSIQRLNRRYNLSLGIYADDCPGGDDNNRWMKEHMEQLQVHLYNFRSDQMSKTDGLNRNCVAYSYRARLKKGILKIPTWNKIQQEEMKIVQETEQKVLISIKAPIGELCDTFDSDMMACIPLLDMASTRDFKMDNVGSEEEERTEYGPRYDKGIKKMTDEEMQQLLDDANAGLLMR